MSCDPCKHGNNPYNCPTCKAEFAELEELRKQPQGPKGVKIIDRRASQQPELKPEPFFKLGFSSSGHFDHNNNFNYGCDWNPVKFDRANRKRKNKAARKARRANR